MTPLAYSPSDQAYYLQDSNRRVDVVDSGYETRLGDAVRYFPDDYRVDVRAGVVVELR